LNLSECSDARLYHGILLASVLVMRFPISAALPRAAAGNSPNSGDASANS
jgi:hypothetical protein